MSRDAERVEVALPLPIHNTFTYAIAGEVPPPGTRVRVPFQRQERIGWIVGPGSQAEFGRLRRVLSVVEAEPSVPPDLLELCRWVADYYAAPLGLALKAAMPSVLTDVSRDLVTLRDASGVALTVRERRVVEWLATRRGPSAVRTLSRALDMGSVWPEVLALGVKGVLQHEVVPPSSPSLRTRRVVRLERHLGTLLEREEAFGRAARQREAYEEIERSGGAVDLRSLTEPGRFSRGVVTALESKGMVRLVDEEEMRDPFRDRPPAVPPDLEPTPDQRRVLDALLGGLAEPRPAPFVLQGVTGSGKTLVYIELLRQTLALGRSAIVLVPEISLTPQTVSRFRAHFDRDVAVLHSGLSDGERYDAWRLLRSGERRIAIGARSALFAPLDRIGAIVVDEEHDGSYKQSEAPRYHARDLAVMRARAHGAVCVLGSATPSLESWHNARSGKFTGLALPNRVGGGRMPSIRVVDLRVGRSDPSEQSRKRSAAAQRGRGVLSEALVLGVDERLGKGEQVILLLNRRGYSSFVQCRSCGEVEQCENCSISMTFHRATRRLRCHHCRHEAPAPDRCPRCASDDLSFRGLGTEQVERVAAEAFGAARIARMDVDTTSGKWAHQRILDRFGAGDIDILLGTQMIAKGLDFPNVTLVGVVNADVGLHLPDFRASERTFQLLSQVAGRAGRGHLPGNVIVQTSLPDHYAIQAAVRHDVDGFARRESEERAGPDYPPHVRLVNVVVSSPDPQLAVRNAESAVHWARSRLPNPDRIAVDVVGPAPCPIERLHRRWRWHFFLRSTSPGELGALSRSLARDFEPSGGDVRLAIDRDPVALL